MDDSDPPPPYSLSAEAGPSHPHPRLDARSLTSHLQSQVASVPGRIQHSLQERHTQQFEADVRLVNELVPFVEEFLVDVGAQHTSPPLAVLTLVPSKAVPPDAVLSGLDDMRLRGEFGRAALVHTARHDDKGSQDSKGPMPRPHDALCDQEWTTGSEFTDWGRWDTDTSLSYGQPSSHSDLFWWQDEAMARRLASYLQPEQSRKPASTPRTAVQASVEQELPANKPKGSWGWSWRTNKPNPPTDSVPSVTTGDASGTVGAVYEAANTGMDMNVTAAEVAFRHANEFGILQSLAGWAVVVTVRLNM